MIVLKRIQSANRLSGKYSIKLRYFIHTYILLHLEIKNNFMINLLPLANLQNGNGTMFYSSGSRFTSMVAVLYEESTVKWPIYTRETSQAKIKASLSAIGFAISSYKIYINLLDRNPLIYFSALSSLFKKKSLYKVKNFKQTKTKKRNSRFIFIKFVCVINLMPICIRPTIHGPNL